MKKLAVLFLVFAVLFGSFGCSQPKDSDSEPESTPSTPSVSTDNTPSTETITHDNMEITILGCRFDNEISGLDEEWIAESYQEHKDRVYVDLVLKVKNVGTTAFTKDSISAYFMYDDYRHDMQFVVESSVLRGFSGDSVAPGTIAIVHLFTATDKEAKNADLVVHYAIGNNTYEIKVAPKDTRTALAKKSKVNVGSTVDVDGLYGFEVISCSEKMVLSASNSTESEQYKPLGKKKMLNLVLKIQNNSQKDITYLDSYSVLSGQIVKGDAKIECNNNTDLEDIVLAPLKPGQEELCHLYVVLDEDVDTNGLLMRFLLGGNCYYCEIT